MTLSIDHVTDLRPAARGAAGTDPAGPLVWQRTDAVGTELVLPSGGDGRSADGTAVVAGPVPHTTSFHAELDPRSAVRALTVTCSGGGWARTLRLSRDADGGWACRTEESGDLDRSLTGSGHAAPPMPGIDDPTPCTARRSSGWTTRRSSSPGRCGGSASDPATDRAPYRPSGCSPRR
jgi:hypothetical protein